MPFTSHASTELDLERSGLPHTILRPSLYMENLLRDAALVRSPAALLAALLAAPAGRGRVGYVAREDVASVAAAVLAEDGHEGAVYEVTGPEALSHAQIAQILSRRTGRRVRYLALPPAVFGLLAGAARLPAWQREVASGLYAATREGRLGSVNDAVERVGGARPKTFDRFAAEHAPRFAPPGGGRDVGAASDVGRGGPGA